ncbi:MAG: P-loop NTPase [Candidatus Manganitrophus sp.]|nr:MAG: P-loop NTPase [Candidatus Manganitrophus sp.]
MRGKSFGSARFDEHLVVLTDPKSIASEQYRVLRSRMEHLSQEKGARTFIVTSPVVGEGKSMTTANLALSLSQSRDRRVALVDCDLRRPTLHRLFGMRMREGFVDVLEERTPLETALVPIEHPSPSPRRALVSSGGESECRLAGMARLLQDRQADHPPLGAV